MAQKLDSLTGKPTASLLSGTSTAHSLFFYIFARLICPITLRSFNLKVEKLSNDGILSTPFDIVCPLSSQKAPC